jgi:UTP--glucose-1-phosphate uridylyltransferase
MLPIGDKPAIHYILQELEDAGVTEVLLLVGRGREVLLNYLDINYEVDHFLEKTKNPIKTNFFEKLNVFYRRVPMPRGVCDCVDHAKQFVGGEDFLLCYCDDVFLADCSTREGREVRMKTVRELVDAGCPSIVVATVERSEAYKYGIVRNNVIVEKPKDLVGKGGVRAVFGRYYLPACFFDLQGDMIERLNQLKAKFVLTKAKHFDIGNKEGLFEAFRYVMGCSPDSR